MPVHLLETELDDGAANGSALVGAQRVVGPVVAEGHRGGHLGRVQEVVGVPAGESGDGQHLSAGSAGHGGVAVEAVEDAEGGQVAQRLARLLEHVAGSRREAVGKWFAQHGAATRAHHLAGLSQVRIGLLLTADALDRVGRGDETWMSWMQAVQRAGGGDRAAQQGKEQHCALHGSRFPSASRRRTTADSPRSLRLSSARPGPSTPVR